MKKSSVWLLVPLFIAFQLITSCSSTQLVSSWRDPETTVDKTKLSKVLVMCLVKDETTRRVAEDEIVKRNPTVFVTSYDKYPAQMLESNPDKMKVEIPSQGYDGIIIMRLVGKEQPPLMCPAATRVTTADGMAITGTPRRITMIRVTIALMNITQ